MSIHTYSVVVFTEDNSIEAVPTNWLKKNKCAWPTTKNHSTIRKLIERKSVPNEIEYTYLNARALKTTGKILNTIVFNWYRYVLLLYLAIYLIFMDFLVHF